uniref:Tc1-like transposase DDE domain-containing protein n=1 Tax=Cyprinus carpio TaxID=7962 RepID=A0A8C1SI32_CYPCA
MDDDPKHAAKATPEFLKAIKWNILQWPSQSPDLSPIERAFHLLKTQLKVERPTNKQQL